MNPIITDYLSKIEFGELKVFNNMAIFPLFTPIHDGPEYLTLGEALEKNLLTITEVSQSGSVPELKVQNRATIPVLLLDGEELAGAKQNRVLNTTILLKENSETIIPVSCTEQGRWAYVSRVFRASGRLMNRDVRMRKVASVSRSLRDNLTYYSSQGEVWDGIACFSQAANVFSSTGAMKDVFDSKETDLKGYIEAFPYVAGQKGILVSVNGKVVGFDILSRSQAYERLHQKIVESYAIDASIHPSKVTGIPSLNESKSFLEAVAACQEHVFPSPGYGQDHRFEGEGMVGSSLVYQERVIHLAFFGRGGNEREEGMASSKRRRSFRT